VRCPRRASRSAPPCWPRPGFANRWSAPLDNVVRASPAPPKGVSPSTRGALSHGGEADDLGVEGRDGRRRGDESVATSVIMTVDTPDVGTAPGVAPSGAAPASLAVPAAAPGPAGFTSVAPTRVLDIRTGVGATRAAVASGATVTATVTGVADLGAVRRVEPAQRWRTGSRQECALEPNSSSRADCGWFQARQPIGGGVIGDNVWGGGPTGHGVSDYRAG
jgi:hypothetical protein